MVKDLPVYYKDVKFTTIENKEYSGYLEPPFSISDDCPFFVVPMLSEKKQGYDALFFHPDDVNNWEYI